MQDVPRGAVRVDDRLADDAGYPRALDGAASGPSTSCIALRIAALCSLPKFGEHGQVLKSGHELAGMLSPPMEGRLVKAVGD